MFKDVIVKYIIFHVVIKRFRLFLYLFILKLKFVWYYIYTLGCSFKLKTTRQKKTLT